MSMDAFAWVVFCFCGCFVIAFLLFLFILAFGEKIERAGERHEKWVERLNAKQQTIYFITISVVSVIFAYIACMRVTEEIYQCIGVGI